VIRAKRISGMAELDDSAICYWKADGNWLLYLPGCGVGNLRNHAVEEHDDGTISANPSILVFGHDNGKPVRRHGYLTRGEWNDCND
jgi:hypothetical protein